MKSLFVHLQSLFPVGEEEFYVIVSIEYPTLVLHYTGCLSLS